MSPVKIALELALSKLPFPATQQWPLGVWDVEMLRHGGISVSVFAPKRTDYQTSHRDDEIYVIVSGHGQLVTGRRRYSFGPGDVLFVPAETDHRFSDFSADLVAWAIFFEAGDNTLGAPDPR